MTGLSPGISYIFRVKARNVIGYSENSETITVLAAQEPDPPTSLANVPAVTNAN